MDELEELEELTETINTAYKARAKRNIIAIRIVKYGLVISGTAMAGLAQFLAVPENGSLSGWTIVGICAVLVVGIGALFIAVSDEDASAELEKARAAMAVASKIRHRLNASIEVYDDYETDLARSGELYTAMSLMKRVVQATMGNPSRAAIEIIRTLLESAERSLLLAIGFELKEHWTICVYIAEPDSKTGEIVLRCIAHLRSIKCELSLARKWPAGVGVAGYAYSNNAEKIVPDMLAPEAGNIFDLGSRAVDHDKQRYRSIAAVPIRGPSTKPPWGMVVATSDQVGHFGTGEDYGLDAAEAIRALAGMIELVLAAQMAQAVAASGPAAQATVQPQKGGGGNG